MDNAKKCKASDVQKWYSIQEWTWHAELQAFLSKHCPGVPSNSPVSNTRKSAFGVHVNTAFNRARGSVSLVVKSSLWVDVCVRQLPTTAGFCRNRTAGESLSPRELPGVQYAQNRIRHACNTALNQASGIVRIVIKSSLWVDVCVRQLTTTAAFW